ncbi:MAG TPA: DNA mismatch repair protein MutT [Clostridiales bacterium]|nr:MAG: DNA mismatch repair protein MutT [Clostridiales bacterium GWD2_32_19]HCC06613.1 DNA mismatch repair protein MutT [Clostridiales bacterium]
MGMTTICYIRKDGKTLMLHRTKKVNDISKDKWLGLGGKFDKGESPEDCIKREVLEESGLKPINLKLRGHITYPAFDGKNDEYMFLFTADDYEGDIIDSREGNLEWVDNDKVFDLNIWEGDKLLFKWMEQDKFFTSKMNYIESKLESYEVIFY